MSTDNDFHPRPIASTLATLLRPARYPERLAKAGGSFLSLPVLSEMVVEEKDGPFLVTNMRGNLVETRRSTLGVARYGFSEIPLEEERHVLVRWYDQLRAASIRNEWTNRCTTAPEAMNRMRNHGLEPKYVVLPKSEFLDVNDAVDEAVDRITLAQGHIADIGDVQVLLADLDKGTALVTTDPMLLGIYTRVGNSLGVLFQRVNQTLMVVGDDLV